MTQPQSQIATGSQLLADAISLIRPDFRVVTNVVAPVQPPCVVIGPPRLFWRGYNQQGQPTTGAWNVYLVVALNQYALDELTSLIADVSRAIEVWTPAVVLGAAPGIYPSPQGGLPSYIFSCQMDFGSL